MGNKNKKKRNSRDSIASGEVEENNKKETVGGNKKKSTSTIGCDIFNEAAMENAYYVCHNVQDVLRTRGFSWPDGPKKKKKGKR